MKILDGKFVANLISKDILSRSIQFQKKFHRRPSLVMVLIGDNPASQVYVRNKAIACEKVQFESRIERLGHHVHQNEVADLLRRLNEDDSVDGILLQLPVPAHLNQSELLNLILSEKDVDCLSARSQELFEKNQALVNPCTPEGIMSIIKHYQIPLTGTKATVIGKSQIVGRPMAILLRRAGADVSVVDSKTENPTRISSQSDVVVVAAGRAQFFGREYFKPGAVVIDVGIHRCENQKLCGDVHVESVKDHLLALTPVPGGVGPMTITSLLGNTIKLAEHRQK